MADSREKLYNDLSEGQLIGPDHHKFQLRETPTQCPLGQLWQADDVSTKEPISVSLIVLDPIFLQSKSFLANFKKQIVRSKPIDHSHVAAIYGYFIQRGGLLFFAFEPVEGLSLDDLMPGSQSKGLNPKQLQGLVSQLGTAIVSCTRQWHVSLGAIDDRLVFVNKKGGVKLLPISMRELFHGMDSLPNDLLGYKISASPELLDAKTLNTQSDCYTLANVAYRLMGDDNFSVKDSAEQRSAAELSQPESLSDEQWQVLTQGLDPDQSKRYSSLMDFIKALFPPEEKPEASTEQTSSPSVSDLDPASEGVTGKLGALMSKRDINFKLGAKEIAFTLPPWALPLGIFLLGLFIGFILGIFSSASKIDAANEATRKWREQAKEQMLELDSSRKRLEALESRVRDIDLKERSVQKQLQNSSSDGPEPLSVFRDELNDGQFGPDMVVIEASNFLMGDIQGVGDDNEKPVHPVALKQKFALSRFEVTFAQYDFFAQQTNRPLPSDEGWGRGEQPVINVTWSDARAYTRWLSQQTDLPYRLPTEAEWEFAARAGTETAYWWGDDVRPGYAHCSDCESGIGSRQPAPVGSLKPNPWGLYDMNGNVDEWVDDCYSDNYANAPKDGVPGVRSSCQYRAMRGGSWFDINRLVRSSSRYRHPPNTKRNAWGFRVALDV
ncbi:MAG: SUMF1/EgtB/PvdO family nonheme iron enzyme [Pseudomonadales bacterium]